MKFSKIISAMVVVLFAGASNATVLPVDGNIVVVSCEQSKSVVSSVDATVLNGTGTDTLELPAPVVVGSACGVSLNALNNVACAAGKKWVVSAPVALTVKGKSNLAYRTTCQ